MYRVIVDVSPKIIPGTNGCHKYAFGSYSTKKEADSVMDHINKDGSLGAATVEKSEH